MIVTLSVIFKFYFIVALIFFTFTYSERYKFLEKLNLATLILGIFFILSFKSSLITFNAFVLIILSTYGFILTRIRPNKETISTISISLVFALLYKVTPEISLVMLILISCAFCFRANNYSIEAFLIFFIIPILVYLSLNNLLTPNANKLFPSLLRIFGLVLIVSSALITVSRKHIVSKMMTYVLFYIGHILFTLSINTPETHSLALILLFLMPFVYSPTPRFISLFNISMLPFSPTFLVKIIMLLIIIKNGLLIDAGLIVASSLAIMSYSTIDLSNLVLEPKKERICIPLALRTVSVSVVLLSLIYLDTVKNVIKMTIRAISG